MFGVSRSFSGGGGGGGGGGGHWRGSGHLQPNVALDVVEQAGDLHAAAVNPRILRPGRANGEGHVSKGNVAMQVVPLRYPVRHPAAAGVQDFVAALGIGAGASAPAHVGDVLAPRHPVGARQGHRLSCCSSNHVFRHRVGYKDLYHNPVKQHRMGHSG